MYVISSIISRTISTKVSKGYENMFKRSNFKFKLVTFNNVLLIGKRAKPARNAQG